ncbi:uncharacterized protein BDW47DRAFT_11256 [Aspergillus candidus]|uniref:Uncharacterized protein n=1 Tax=Aspergillus candidus TaxID=41067 RepID=A0A2I2FG93_ASPCN|nr:hypothetical protein BDW47DRAFT_11256 [Aspergillus candidus]PLB39654.1 hypothetical protein BDW47DRAFT_11256 [Aspergillus candidus]
MTGAWNRFLYQLYRRSRPVLCTFCWNSLPILWFCRVSNTRRCVVQYQHHLPPPPHLPFWTLPGAVGGGRGWAKRGQTREISGTPRDTHRHRVTRGSARKLPPVQWVTTGDSYDLCTGQGEYALRFCLAEVNIRSCSPLLHMVACKPSRDTPLPDSGWNSRGSLSRDGDEWHWTNRR